MRSKKFNKNKIATAVSVCIYASAINLGTMVELARAQTTTTDLYTSALAAIQAYGYQPTSGIQAGPGTTMVATAFQGGSLQGGAMVFSTNSGTEAASDVTSWYICNYSTDSVSFSFSGTESFTDSTTITSSTSTSNTSSSFQNGSTSLTLSYSPPGTTGGTSASGTQTYNYGTSNSVTTSSGTSTGTDSTTAVATKWSGQVTVAPGMAQQITTSVQTSTISSPWTAPATLTSPSAFPITSVLYTQYFSNTIAPTLYQANLGGGANLWVSPNAILTWSPNSQGLWGLASPNGAYNFANSGGLMAGNYFTSTSPYSWWNVTDDYGSSAGDTVNFAFNATAPGAIYTIGTSGSTYWSASGWSTDAAYVGVDNTGAMNVYDLSFNVLWTTGAAPSASQPYNNLSYPYVPTITQLLGSTSYAFSVAGTYDASSYSSTGNVSYGTAVTIAEAGGACTPPSGFTVSSKIQDKQKLAQVDQSGKSGTQKNIVSNLLSWSGLVKDAVASDAIDRNDPNRRDQRYRTNQVTGSSESTRSNKGSATRENNSNDRNSGSDGRKFIVKEITKSFYLKPNEFASTSDPSVRKLRIKITPIPGKHLTNEVTFAAGPLEEIQNPKRKTTFKVKKNKKTTFKVGRS